MRAEMNLEYLNECFKWDYDGNLTWKERPRSHFTTDGGYKRFITRFANKQAGGIIKTTGYHGLRINGNSHRGHRILYMLYHNTTISVGIEVDHIDENKSNNTFKNLRLGTSRQNKCNVSKRKDNTSGYKGVYFHKNNNKFRARINACGKFISLGYYVTAEEAHEAYKAASVKYHGEFSNFG